MTAGGGYRRLLRVSEVHIAPHCHFNTHGRPQSFIPGPTNHHRLSAAPLKTPRSRPHSAFAFFHAVAASLVVFIAL